MATVLKDRVKVSSGTNGAGTITLGAAATGYQDFAAIGNGNVTYYTIALQSGSEWEVGRGTVTQVTGIWYLSRDLVLESSNAGALVTFSTGTKDVFVTYPAERAIYLDDAGTYPVQNTFNTLNATTATLTGGTVSTTPSSGTDLVNKSYVDTVAAQGIVYHDPVYVESPNTAGNLTALYNQPGGPGVGIGATLTNNGAKAALVIDGVLMTTTKRVLIYNQTNAFENGVYTVTTVGTPDPGGTNWVLTRATDADTYAVNSPTSLGQGDAFFVSAGNTGAGELYSCNTVGTIIFGTTNITFAQISATVPYMAGTGLNLSPSTTFNISNVGTAGTYGSASSVPVFATNAQGQVTSATPTAIAIAAAAVSGLAASATTDTTNAANITSGTLPSGRLNGSYTGITGVGTLAAGTWNGSVIAAVYGGTGLSSYAVGDLVYADTTTSLAKLADVVSGNALLSGGVSSNPAWGKIGLTTHVDGTLPVGNGGTGATTLTGYVYGNGTGAMTASTSIPNAATTATSANTASAIVARDASGNFTAGTITAALNGNATTATTAANVNNGTLSMAVSGTGLSGSASFTANQSGNSTFTVTSNATNLNTASTVVARDASGNFVAGTITAALSGNATTATSATTAGTATNLAAGVAGAVPFQSGVGATGFSAAGTSGQYLQSNGTTAPSWITPPTIGNGTLTMNVSGVGLSGSQTFTANQTGAGTFTVTSNATNLNTASTIVARDASGNFTAGTITAALSGNATTAGNVTGIVAAVNGGTGQSVYAVGDLVYASTTTALSKLADVATGNAVISGGVGVAPGYGKIGLTTHVSGTLPTANGGTNLTAFTANGVVYASSTSALATGTALTFDGTNLAIGASPTFFGGQVATAGSIAITGGSLLKLWNTGGTGVGSISSPGTDTLAFGIGGSFTEQMRLTSTGLGIGTSSPAYKLDVVGTANTFMSVGSTGASSGRAILYLDKKGTATKYNWLAGAQYNVDNAFEITPSTAVGGTTFSTPSLVVLQSGNVGIGTTAPAYKLDIAGTTTQMRIVNSVGNAERLLITTDSSGVTFNAFNTAATTQPYIWKGFTAELMRLDASGNLLVGTTSSLARITVSRPYGKANGILQWIEASDGSGTLTDNVALMLNDGSSGSSGGNSIIFRQTNSATPRRYAGIWGATSATGAGGNLIFGTINTDNDVAGPTERMRIDNIGNVGIGDTTPSYKLDVAGVVSGTAVRASNGIVVNSATISANYTIATGDNGLSAGPVTVNSGITVTVSSGSVWTVV